MTISSEITLNMRGKLLHIRLDGDHDLVAALGMQRELQRTIPTKMDLIEGNKAFEERRAPRCVGKSAFPSHPQALPAPGHSRIDEYGRRSDLVREAYFAGLIGGLPRHNARTIVECGLGDLMDKDRRGGAPASWIAPSVANKGKILRLVSGVT